MASSLTSKELAQINKTLQDFDLKIGDLNDVISRMSEHLAGKETNTRGADIPRAKFEEVFKDISDTAKEDHKAFALFMKDFIADLKKGAVSEEMMPSKEVLKNWEQFGIDMKNINDDLRDQRRLAKDIEKTQKEELKLKKQEILDKKKELLREAKAKTSARKIDKKVESLAGVFHTLPRDQRATIQKILKETGGLGAKGNQQKLLDFKGKTDQQKAIDTIFGKESKDVLGDEPGTLEQQEEALAKITAILEEIDEGIQTGNKAFEKGFMDKVKDAIGMSTLTSSLEKLAPDNAEMKALTLAMKGMGKGFDLMGKAAGKLRGKKADTEEADTESPVNTESPVADTPTPAKAEKPVVAKKPNMPVVGEDGKLTDHGESMWLKQGHTIAKNGGLIKRGKGEDGKATASFVSMRDAEQHLTKDVDDDDDQHAEIYVESDKEGEGKGSVEGKDGFSLTDLIPDIDIDISRRGAKKGARAASKKAARKAGSQVAKKAAGSLLKKGATTALRFAGPAAAVAGAAYTGYEAGSFAMEALGQTDEEGNVKADSATSKFTSWLAGADKTEEERSKEYAESPEGRKQLADLAKQKEMRAKAKAAVNEGQQQVLAPKEKTTSAELAKTDDTVEKANAAQANKPQEVSVISSPSTNTAISIPAASGGGITPRNPTNVVELSLARYARGMIPS